MRSMRGTALEAGGWGGVGEAEAHNAFDPRESVVVSMANPTLHGGCGFRSTRPGLRSQAGRMANQRIRIPYNRDMGELEMVLAGVERPGEFFVQGALELPMPRVEVEGVGTLSFPVPGTQVAEVMAKAARAPYGRGEATLIDESVRRTWQVTADGVRVGGTSWLKAFPQILGRVVAGLGCEGVPVTAELYKLLVYEAGGFFKAHRDTEKTPGMFGTLVVVLPSEHEGGELVIRHGGQEAVVDLAATEFTEVRFAAFYADCEHEVRPVRKGHRVCLVYNLVHARDAGVAPVVPGYVQQAEQVAAMIRRAFGGAHPPLKLAWLLEHQYSPAGLSFGTLKGADAARGQVLRDAATQADCAVHLGIVHIEETGGAIPNDEGSRYGRGSRWGRERELHEGADVRDDRFEIIEPQETSLKVDGWVNASGRAMDFGELPVGERELIPAGALDREPPDRQRLMEATGNEGATYERSYHRAAVVLWPSGRFVSLLMQVGPWCAVPHLEERLDAGDAAAVEVARQVVEGWDEGMNHVRWDRPDPGVTRARMLRVLTRLGDAALVRAFLPVFLNGEHGTDADVAVQAMEVLGAGDSRESLLAFVRDAFPERPAAVVRLLGGLAGREAFVGDTAAREVLGAAAVVLVEAIPGLAEGARRHAPVHEWLRRKEPFLEPSTVDGALGFLAVAGATPSRVEAARRFVGTGLMEPVTLTVPVLARMDGRAAGACASDDAARWLWKEAAVELLARSEYPPVPPKDWRQDVRLGCTCEQCLVLQAFIRDPNERVLRIKAAQHRRSHVETEVTRHRLDMDCTTDATGRPFALVCVKNRQSHEAAVRAHAADCAAMATLLRLMKTMPESLRALAARLAEAQARGGA